jgi:hypothetical protein
MSWSKALVKVVEAIAIAAAVALSSYFIIDCQVQREKAESEAVIKCAESDNPSSCLNALNELQGF